METQLTSSSGFQCSITLRHETYYVNDSRWGDESELRVGWTLTLSSGTSQIIREHYQILTEAQDAYTKLLSFALGEIEKLYEALRTYSVDPHKEPEPI